MFETAVASSGDHPVLDAAGLVSAASRAVLASSATSLSLAEVRRAATDLQAAAAQLEAAWLHVVRLQLEREDASARPGAQTVAWMNHALRAGQGRARADVAAARATDPTGGALPSLGAALAEGAVSREHVDVAVRTLRLLPTGMVREQGAEVDRLVTAHARSFSPSDARVLAKHLIKTVSPDGPDAFDDEAHERRFIEVSTDRTGMVQLQGQLEPVGGAVVVAVLDHLSSPDRQLPPPAGAEPTPAGATDERTLTQRHADAVVEMAHLAAAHLKLVNPTLEPARVVVHCTPEQLSHPDAPEPCAGDAASHLAPGPATCELTGPVSASTLHRHACDAVLERVVLDRTGAVLRMESLGRLATRAQRRALAARDGGCARPGCSAPPSWTEAHHVVWWSRDGRTVLENLVLLCPRHHTEIHREHWTITMRDGVPWFIPPRWVDPDQVPLRNTVHLAIEATRRAGQRLVAGQALDDDPAPPSAA